MINATDIAQKVFDIIEQMHEMRRPAIVPSKTAFCHVIEEMFWSSVDRYEGNLLRTRIFFAPQAALIGAGIVQLVSPIPVFRGTIRQLSPTQDRDGALLVVENMNNGLHIKAIMGSTPFRHGVYRNNWLGVESRGPGSLRIRCGWQIILDFSRGTLKQLGGMSLDRTAAACILMSASLFPTEPAGLNLHISSMLLDIGSAIEQHGKGGALWLLPPGASMGGELEGLGHRVELDASWWEPFREMLEMRTSVIRLLNPGCDKGHEFLQEAAQQFDFRRQDAVTRSLSSLTKIDGAIVMNGSPQVLAFGVICNKFSFPARKVQRSTDPSHPLVGEVEAASAFGGSRHRSAIDFCSSYSPAGAVVASEDGGLTVFASTEKGYVIGSRVSMINSDPDVKGK